MRISTLVVILFAMTIPVLNAQESQPKTPVFGSSLEMVNVILTVTDEKSRPVAGLTPHDVLLYDSGKRQDIAVFVEQLPPTDFIVMIDTSLSMGQAPTTMTDVRNPRPLDEDVKIAAKELVKSMRPEDQMVLMPFAERPPAGQSFTDNKETLKKAIDSLQATGNTSLYQSIYEVLKTQVPQPQSDKPRRSVIVLITDGEDTSSLFDQDYVMTQIKKGQAAIYSVELPHLPVGTEARQRAIEAHDFLSQAARESGGFNQVLKSAAESAGACSKIVHDLKSQYWIGYQPDTPTDGKWHEVKVQILGKPNYVARHRGGYYATKRK